MSGAASPWSREELLAVSASRLLEDGKVVFAGVGTPLLASVLARSTHAPQLTIVVEGGAIGPDVRAGQLPISTNEMAAGRHAMMLTGITDTFLFAQRGFAGTSLPSASSYPCATRWVAAGSSWNEVNFIPKGFATRLRTSVS